MAKRLLVLVPAYNEEKNLPSLFEAFEQVVQDVGALGWEAHFLIIDDGSADATSNVADGRGFRVLRLVVNLGYGAALQTGFKFAKNENYDAAVCIDADGQHQPSDIVKLLNVFDTGEYHVVLGSRFVEDTGYETNWARYLGIKMFSVILRLASGKKIVDVTTGFQMISKPVISLFADEYPHDYPDAQVLLLLTLTGYKIKEVPVYVKQRLHGTSMHGSLKSLLYPLRNLFAILIMLLRVSTISKRIQTANSQSAHPSSVPIQSVNVN